MKARDFARRRPSPGRSGPTCGQSPRGSARSFRGATTRLRCVRFFGEVLRVTGVEEQANRHLVGRCHTKRHQPRRIRVLVRALERLAPHATEASSAVRPRCGLPAPTGESPRRSSATSARLGPVDDRSRSSPSGSAPRPPCTWGCRRMRFPPHRFPRQHTDRRIHQKR